MKKIFAILMFVATVMPAAARAERYFNGYLTYTMPASSVDTGRQICADLSNFSNGGKVYFSLNTCQNMFRLGFTGDNHVVLSVNDESGRQGYVVSKYPAASLRNEVEHGNIGNTSGETLQLVQALAADRVVQKQNEAAANDYALTAYQKEKKKLKLGQKIETVESGIKLYYLFSNKDQNVKDRGTQRADTIGGAAQTSTGSDPNVIGAQANLDNLLASCIARGGCQ